MRLDNSITESFQLRKIQEKTASSRACVFFVFFTAGSNLADVHGLAAAGRLDHGFEALGGAEELLGLIHVVPLFSLQSRLHVLLPAALQEVQLLNGCRINKTERKSNSNSLCTRLRNLDQVV